MLNDTDTDTFSVPNIFGTKFSDTDSDTTKKWKIPSTGTKLAINGALFGKHTKFGIIQFRIGEKIYEKVGEKSV